MNPTASVTQKPRLSLTVRLMNMIAREPIKGTQPYTPGASKIASLLGDDIFQRVAGKVVVDFGCGYGDQTFALAPYAKEVIGVDIQEHCLNSARARAEREGVRNVRFVSRCPDTYADIVISTDAFEHFAQPAQILNEMFFILKPGGELITAFGPTWLHPKGGHLFSPRPWFHLWFSERALCEWRAQHRFDGARYFRDVDGGLNQMTIKHWEELVRDSPFDVRHMEYVPIKKKNWIMRNILHNRLTREFLTSQVRATLVKTPIAE